MVSRVPISALARHAIVLAIAWQPAGWGVAQLPDRGASARLTWARLPGAEACPDGATLAADVTRRLGYDPFARGAPEHFVEGAVRPSADGYEADLIFREPNGQSLGERHLESAQGADCIALGRATALAIAVAIDPEAALLPGAGSAPANASPEPVAEAPHPDQASDPELPGPELQPTGGTGPRGPELALALRAEAQWGTLPRSVLAWGPGIAGAVRWPSGVRIAVGGYYLPIDEVEGVGFGLVAGWLEGCFEPDVGKAVRLGVCSRLAGGAQIATVDVRGTPPSNLEAFDAGQHAWGAAGVVLRASVLVWGPVFAALDAGALVGWVRNRYVVTSTEDGVVVGRETFQEPPAAFVGSFAVGVAID